MKLRLSMIALAVSLLSSGCEERVSTTSAEASGGEARGVVNVYSARHYDTDDALYAQFTEQTGVEVNVIEGNADQLLERIEREGAASPADVFIAVDAARLHRAVERELLQAAASPVLEERIPATRRHPDGLWFGLTERVRVIVTSRDRVPEGAVTTYEQLVEPEWKGRVLIRSSSNVYNQSLVASLIDSVGSEAAEQWCQGIVSNLARSPQGGDTDQVRAVAAGAGDVAIVNHYYVARLLAGGPDNAAVGDAVRVVFPNQEDRGAHVNVSGAGVVAGAPNAANAIRFIEFLASDEAQEILANQNFEYPVVEGISSNPILDRFGSFRSDATGVTAYGLNNSDAVKMMDRSGWR
ncbi:MAG: extracellular solute-binding protein [Planctomycetota bacterium]